MFVYIKLYIYFFIYNGFMSQCDSPNLKIIMHELYKECIESENSVFITKLLSAKIKTLL